MSIITSYSVGNGDMFTIKHNENYYTIIDCCYENMTRHKARCASILQDAKGRQIRFISTHPDEDHIKGIKLLFDYVYVNEFYLVKNRATKYDQTMDFKYYCRLRDFFKNRNYIYRGRLIDGDIQFLWPDVSDGQFKAALRDAADGKAFNNISPIIMYSTENDIKILWMGDLETEFMEKIKYEVDWPEVDILFAPHHGRASGRVPSDILEAIDPTLIVIGEAPSKDIDYYSGYDTVTQNSAGTIKILCKNGQVKIFCSEKNYDPCFNYVDQGNNAKIGSLGYLKGSFSV